jgi:hypothetical protein
LVCRFSDYWDNLFLKTGVKLAYFHSDGKVESANDKLNSLHTGYLSIDAASLRSIGFTELFNDYFCKQADLNDSETFVPDITDILTNGLEQITITENEVEDILKILDTSKAIGPDLLNPMLLKEAASILKYPVCRLFNLSLGLSTFPSEWKYANLTPVFKKRLSQ